MLTAEPMAEQKRIRRPRPGRGDQGRQHAIGRPGRHPGGHGTAVALRLRAEPTDGTSADLAIQTHVAQGRGSAQPVLPAGAGFQSHDRPGGRATPRLRHAESDQGQGRASGPARGPFAHAFALIKTADGNLDKLQTSLESWFDGQMDRVSGSYKLMGEALGDPHRHRGGVRLQYRHSHGVTISLHRQRPAPPSQRRPPATSCASRLRATSRPRRTACRTRSKTSSSPSCRWLDRGPLAARDVKCQHPEPEACHCFARPRRRRSGHHSGSMR